MDTFADLGCASWNGGDWGRYNGEPLDTFAFGFENEKVANVRLEGWSVVLERQKE